MKNPFPNEIELMDIFFFRMWKALWKTTLYTHKRIPLFFPTLPLFHHRIREKIDILGCYCQTIPQIYRD
jgi:hypothetical protein